jgi:hypothetical protein
MLSYVVGGVCHYGTLSTIISTIINKYVSHFSFSPTFVLMELQTIQWFAKYIIGYTNEKCGGTLTTGNKDYQ